MKYIAVVHNPSGNGAGVPFVMASFFGATKDKAVSLAIAYKTSTERSNGYTGLEVLIGELTERAVVPTPTFELEPLKG
jgi:hypothetical protein